MSCPIFGGHRLIWYATLLVPTLFRHETNILITMATSWNKLQGEATGFDNPCELWMLNQSLGGSAICMLDIGAKNREFLRLSSSWWGGCDQEFQTTQERYSLVLEARGAHGHV